MRLNSRQGLFSSVNIYHPAKRCDPLRMDIYSIRKQNLLALLSGKKQRACAEKWDTSPSTLSQITSANAVRNLGDELARKIERAEGLPAGWMDTLQTGGPSHSNIEPGPPITSPFRAVKIVGTAQMGSEGYWYQLDEGDGVVDVPSSDPGAYALRLKGDSMAPAIRSGWIAVVEPNHRLVPGEYVMIRLEDGESMLKELLYANDVEISVMSINDAYGRRTIPVEQIAQIHYVGAIVPPSKVRM